MKLNSSPMFRYSIVILVFAFGCIAESPEKGSKTKTEQEVEYNTTGPTSGSLVIVGGAMKDPAILAKFFELGGGIDQHFIVVPTAGADTITHEMKEKADKMMKAAGATNVTILHTKDRSEANSEEFIKPIQSASGIFFTGGRQWRIADSYLGTKTEEEFHKVLERGGVIGGSSAGATIQGSYLARGDTKTNVIMMGDHEEGFSFVKNIAIDQHLLQRNRQFDLVEIIRAQPHLLGICLDENTAVVVSWNQFEVIGQSFVAVFDHKLWQSNKSKDTFYPFFLLRPGDKYDMKGRKVIWDGNNRGENAIFDK